MVQMFMWDLKKVSALWSVRYRVFALESFCYKGFLRNSSGTKYFARLREVSALEMSALGRFHCIHLLFCSIYIKLKSKALDKTRVRHAKTHAVFHVFICTYQFLLFFYFYFLFLFIYLFCFCFPLSYLDICLFDCLFVKDVKNIGQ